MPCFSLHAHTHTHTQLEEKLPALCALHGLCAPLPRILGSPFRGPLTRFLIKYASEAAAYFLDPQVRTYVLRIPEPNECWFGAFERKV